jgi:glyoxylase-like metal-dependent hydrolase (beta-lactamase superfamily II)
VDGVFEIPIGFVNAFLVVVDDGAVLIDTGLSGRVGVVEKALAEDDAVARASARRLAALEFEVAVFGHGRAVTGRAVEGFRALAS